MYVCKSCKYFSLKDWTFLDVICCRYIRRDAYTDVYCDGEVV